MNHRRKSRSSVCPSYKSFFDVLYNILNFGVVTVFSAFHYKFYPRRAKRALGSGENSSRLLFIDSEMAGRIRLKLGGIVEGMQENDLAKEFFRSVNIGHGQVGGPQVPLLRHEDD